MPEFTLSIETPEGRTTDEDVMGRFDEADAEALRDLGPDNEG